MCEDYVSVSVIIPYYNSEGTIIRALESVINQTYKDFEIILIDDGSYDNSYKKVEKFMSSHKDFKIKNLHQGNYGPSKARNLGVKCAEGEYIAFLDSDDSWDRNKLDIQMEYLKKNKDIAILGSDHNIVIENKVYKKSKDTGKFIGVSFYKKLFKNYFAAPTVVIKKEAFEDVEGFNETQRYAEDPLLYSKVLRKYKGGKIESPLVNIYKNLYGDSGLSSNLKKCQASEIRNFKLLRDENPKYHKKIGYMLYIFVILFSYIKYIRRVVIVYIRSRERH
jgi:glycosyltransferase involved in cell wall biosynthesis